MPAEPRGSTQPVPARGDPRPVAALAQGWAADPGEPRSAGEKRKPGGAGGAAGRALPARCPLLLPTSTPALPGAGGGEVCPGGDRTRGARYGSGCAGRQRCRGFLRRWPGHGHGHGRGSPAGGGGRARAARPCPFPESPAAAGRDSGRGQGVRKEGREGERKEGRKDGRERPNPSPSPTHAQQSRTEEPHQPELLHGAAPLAAAARPITPRPVLRPGRGRWAAPGASPRRAGSGEPRQRPAGVGSGGGGQAGSSPPALPHLGPPPRPLLPPSWRGSSRSCWDARASSPAPPLHARRPECRQSRWVRGSLWGGSVWLSCCRWRWEAVSSQPHGAAALPAPSRGEGGAGRGRSQMWATVRGKRSFWPRQLTPEAEVRGFTSIFPTVTQSHGPGEPLIAARRPWPLFGVPTNTSAQKREGGKSAGGLALPLAGHWFLAQFPRRSPQAVPGEVPGSPAHSGDFPWTPLSLTVCSQAEAAASQRPSVPRPLAAPPPPHCARATAIPAWPRSSDSLPGHSHCPSPGLEAASHVPPASCGLHQVAPAPAWRPVGGEGSVLPRGRRQGRQRREPRALDSPSLPSLPKTD